MVSSAITSEVMPPVGLGLMTTGPRVAGGGGAGDGGVVPLGAGVVVDGEVVDLPDDDFGEVVEVELVGLDVLLVPSFPNSPSPNSPSPSPGFSSVGAIPVPVASRASAEGWVVSLAGPTRADAESPGVKDWASADASADASTASTVETLGWGGSGVAATAATTTVIAMAVPRPASHFIGSHVY